MVLCRRSAMQCLQLQLSLAQTMAISNAEIGGGTGVSERWSSALLNVTELGSSLESLQRLLLDKAVYMDEEAFAQASAKSHQTRIIKSRQKRGAYRHWKESLTQQYSQQVMHGQKGSKLRWLSMQLKLALNRLFRSLKIQPRFLHCTWRS